MSVQVDLSERQLKLGILKLAIALTGLLLLVAAIISLAFDSEGPFARIPFYGLMISLGVMFLANGFLALLRIIDWFEDRRARREVSNG